MEKENENVSVNDVFEKVKTQYTQNETTEYLVSMDDKSKLAMSIALEHLGTSFNLRKSNGYVSYYKK
jgi:Mg/Co/Ni transporter MgtE